MRRPITFKATEKERELIESMAKEQSLPVGTFCRFVVLQTIKQQIKMEEVQE